MRRILVGLAAVVVLAACTPTPRPPQWPGPGHPQAQCDYARFTVSYAGAVLPAGWDFHCPSPSQHDGNSVVYPSGLRYVEIGPGALDDNDGGRWLRYVVAHEICHARGYEGLENGTWDSEALADACAARYGFARP